MRWGLAFLAVAAVACGARTGALDSSFGSSEGGLDAERRVVDAERDLADDGEEGGTNSEAGIDGGADVVDATVDTTVVDAKDGAPLDALDETLPESSADELPSTAPCLAGGNVFWMDAEPGALGWQGMQTLTSTSVWAVGAQADGAYYDTALIEVHPAGSKKGDPFRYITFGTAGAATALKVGVVYKNAHPLNLPDPVRGPELTLGYDQTCGSGVGTFRLDEFSTEGDAAENSLLAITATFTARCEGSVFRGCLHYEP